MSENPTVKKMVDAAQVEDGDPESVVKTDAGRGHIGLVRLWLSEHAAEYHIATNSYYWAETNFSLKELAEHVHLHLEVGGKRPSKDHLYSALREVAAAERKARIVALRRDLCIGPRNDDKELRAWLQEMLVPTITAAEFENCVAVMKHWLWLVQRALLGLKQEWHIMPIFWGAGGSGKSHNIKLLLSPLGSFWDEASFAVFDSGRFNSMPLHWSFALLLDEMENVEGADSSALKRTISSDYLLGRGMFSEDGRHRRRNASFMAVTNDPPPHGLKDTSSARRFYSLHCNELPCLPGTPRKAFFDNADYLAIWRCVDPHAAAPIEKRKNQIKLMQHDINRARSLLEEFLEERCDVVLTDKGEPDDNVSLSFRLLARGLLEYSLDRNVRHFVVPTYRHLRPQLETLGIQCNNQGNIPCARGLRFKSEIPEAD